MALKKKNQHSGCGFWTSGKQKTFPKVQPSFKSIKMISFSQFQACELITNSRAEEINHPGKDF